MCPERVPRGKILMGSQGIIQPVKGRDDPEVSPDTLMIMVHTEVGPLVDLAAAKRIPINDVSLGRIYYSHQKRGVPVTLSGPFLGAPQAVMGMEKLIALGAKRLWVLGWCGSLQSSLNIGDIVIPLSAISEEGTSQHYPLIDRIPQPDPILTSSLERALTHEGIFYLKGPVWTTDAPYRETPEKVRKYQNQGILAVEMEISALMTVACYRGVALAALLVVSDQLYDLRWEHGFSTSLLRNACQSAGKILLNTIWSMDHDYGQ